jgi:hypothetical protein
MKTVRIADGVVIEIMVVPQGMTLAKCYPAAIVRACAKAPDEVQIGWVTDDGGKTFSEPLGPDVSDSPIQCSFIDFLGLFTQAEQAEIVSSDDVQIKIFCLMAAGATVVDLTDPRTVAGTKQLETLKLIAKGRAAQVLAGNAPPAS